MELTVKERLILMQLLPKEGNFTTLKLMRKLKEELSFDEEEHKILQFKSTSNQLSWDFEQSVMKDVQIGEVMMEKITTDLKKMDKESKLTEDHFSLFEKFCE